ncbi:MAG: guanylate kinase [bacterium]|nr:guanylate kinase [bacterium]
MVVISGPSGAGKTTLIRALMERLPALAFSVSATTRPPRPGELDGTDYYFLTPDEFQERIKAGEFLEFAEVYGHAYGTLRGQVERFLAGGRDVVLDIDTQGAAQLRSAGLDAIHVFVMPPSLDHARDRMNTRGTEDALSCEQRLRRAPAEIAARTGYDYVVCNDRMEEAVTALAAVILAERCRAARLLPPHEGSCPEAAGSEGGGPENGGDRCPHDEAIAGRADAKRGHQVYAGGGRSQAGATDHDGLCQARGM